MIEVSIRLRRAILLHDILLVKRIIKNHPTNIQNPDYADRGNTSLHLAAKEGQLPICEFLIQAGHESSGGVSRNEDGETPLMVAAASPSTSEAVIRLFCDKFPRCVKWTNKSGVDALMMAAKAGNDAAIQILLKYDSDPNAQDQDGNTALHFASAYGHLKALQTLLLNSASPHTRNHFSWTPMSYSLTVQAEVYFKNLVHDLEAAASMSASSTTRQNSMASQASYFPPPSSYNGSMLGGGAGGSYRRPPTAMSNSSFSGGGPPSIRTNGSSTTPPAEFPYPPRPPSSASSNTMFSTNGSYADTLVPPHPSSQPPPPPPPQSSQIEQPRKVKPTSRAPSTLSTLNLAHTRSGGASAVFLAAAITSDSAERAASAAEFRHPPPPIFPDRVERAPTPVLGSGNTSATNTTSSGGGLGGVRTFITRGRARSGS